MYLYCTCLLDVNVASRKGLGTSEGLRLAMNFHRICKIKYGTYYVLKCDISKFLLSLTYISNPHNSV